MGTLGWKIGWKKVHSLSTPPRPAPHSWRTGRCVWGGVWGGFVGPQVWATKCARLPKACRRRANSSNLLLDHYGDASAHLSATSWQCAAVPQYTWSVSHLAVVLHGQLSHAAGLQLSFSHNKSPSLIVGDISPLFKSDALLPIDRFMKVNLVQARPPPQIGTPRRANPGRGGAPALGETLGRDQGKGVRHNILVATRKMSKWLTNETEE